MKTDLYDTLGARADRVDPDLDVDAFLRDVRSRADSHGRRRRNSLAAGGGVVAVVALVAGTIALTSLGSHDASNRQPVGSPPTVSARHDRLVAIKPAPASAPLSVSLAPKGWRYLSSGQPVALYGPRNTPDPNESGSFVGKLALIVGERYPGDGPLPLAVGAYRGSYNVEGGTQTLYLAITKKIDVTIQVPAKARLSRAEVIDVGKTLDVRDISHPAKG